MRVAIDYHDRDISLKKNYPKSSNKKSSLSAWRFMNDIYFLVEFTHTNPCCFRAGFALFMEGLMSACYHVCPNYSNFQFGKLPFFSWFLSMENNDSESSECLCKEESLHKEWRFPLRVSSVNVTICDHTEEILNGKLHFLCSECIYLPSSEGRDLSKQFWWPVGGT